MSSGILDQLDKLALTITTADDDLADIASTADLSTQIDGLGDLLSKEDFVEAAVVFSGLSSVVEKFLMNQAPPDRGPAAIELINDSVTFVREYIDGSLQPDEIGGLMNPILAAMKEKFDVAPQQQDVSAKTENTGSESAGAAGSEPAGAAGFDMAGSDKKQTAVSPSKAKKKGPPQHTVLKLIDEKGV
ncbi:MAG: hypothetical protein IEMM0002_1216 [bacterium]|nr:MAG: hypothetical protein IEMM0002_1216 [bacterium]